MKNNNISSKTVNKAWDKMSEVLDREMPTEKKERRGIFFWWYYSLPLFLVGLGAWYFLRSSSI